MGEPHKPPQRNEKTNLLREMIKTNLLREMKPQADPCKGRHRGLPAPAPSSDTK